jgi:hypothetical protein
MTRGGLETVSTESGTEGSNPALSSDESATNRAAAWGALPSRNACNGRRRSDRGAGLEFLPNDVREDFGGYLYWNTELQA